MAAILILSNSYLVSGHDLACQQEVSLALTKTLPIHYYRPFSYCIDQAGLGAFTAKSGRKHYNPPPLTVM